MLFQYRIFGRVRILRQIGAILIGQNYFFYISQSIMLRPIGRPVLPRLRQPCTPGKSAFG